MRFTADNLRYERTRVNCFPEMVPNPSEMSRTSDVRGILDISDGSGKGQPRAVKVASAGFAPRPFKPAKVSVRGRNMQLHEKLVVAPVQQTFLPLCDSLLFKIIFKYVIQIKITWNIVAVIRKQYLHIRNILSEQPIHRGYLPNIRFHHQC